MTSGRRCRFRDVLPWSRSWALRRSWPIRQPTWQVAAYAALLCVHGLSPAPGYLSAPPDDAARHDETITRAGTLARQHEELGQTELFVAALMSLTAPRIARPAVGTGRDPERLKRIAQTLELIGVETRHHGVMAYLHRHVGTWSML